MTNRQIKTLKGTGKRQALSVGDGVVLRVSPDAASKVFIWSFRRNGRQSRKEWITLGAFPALTLDAARAKAHAARQTLREGGEPGAVEKTAARQRGDQMTINELLDLFLPHWIKTRKPSTLRTYKSCINLYIRPWWGARRVGDLAAGTIKLKLDELAAVHNRMATLTFSVVGAMFTYAKMLRDDEPRLSGFTHPLRGLEKNDKPGKKSQPRTRTLNNQELQSLIGVASSHGRRIPQGWKNNPKAREQRAAAQILLLHLLSGQRRCELVRMRWCDIGAGDDGKLVWTIPATDTKNKLVHEVPVTSWIEDVLRERGWDDAESRADDLWVFPTTAKQSKCAHIQDPKKSVRGIYKVAGITWGQQVAKGTTEHDLRRTVNRRLKSLRYSQGERALLLNHATGGFTDDNYEGDSIEDLASDVALKRRMINDWHRHLRVDVLGEKVGTQQATGPRRLRVA